MERVTEKKQYISILSVLSCFAVVMLHHNGTVYEFGTDLRWFAANFVECLCYCAVPVFLMISGATLMDYRKKYDTTTYFKKRVIKTVIPYIIWITIAVFYKVLIGEFQIGELCTVKFWFECYFWHYSMFFVYAFFMYLFAVYLSIPVISLIPENVRKHTYLYMIAMFMITGSAIPLFAKVFGYTYDHKLSIAVVGGYLVYPLIGYCIDRYPLSKRQRFWVYAAGIASYICFYAGNFFMSMRNGIFDETFEDYLEPFVILYAAAVFTLFKYMDSGRLGEVVFRFLYIITKPFGSVTFGVYLIHVYIYLTALHFSGISEMSALWRFGGPVVVFLLSALIVWIMQKIPLIRRMVPQ